MAYPKDDFTSIGTGEGKMRAEMEGEVQETDYKARFYVNRAATIGYIDVEVAEAPGHLFLSRTKDGKILTMPGQGTGLVDLKVEGYDTIWAVPEGSDVDLYYDEHLKAMEGKELIADEEWFRKELPDTPQATVEVMMVIFAAACKMMEEMMGQLGEAMGGAMEQVGEAMGGAMEGMAEGMANAMNEMTDNMIGSLEENVEKKDVEKKDDEEEEKVAEEQEKKDEEEKKEEE